MPNTGPSPNLNIIEIDKDYHDCIARSLNKTESASLHMAKFSPSEREKWSDSFIEYASVLGIDAMLQRHYPFRVVRKAKFHAHVEAVKSFLIKRHTLNMREANIRAHRAHEEYLQQQAARAAMEQQAALNMQAQQQAHFQNMHTPLRGRVYPQSAPNRMGSPGYAPGGRPHAPPHAMPYYTPPPRMGGGTPPPRVRTPSPSVEHKYDDNTSGLDDSQFDDDDMSVASTMSTPSQNSSLSQVSSDEIPTTSSESSEAPPHLPEDKTRGGLETPAQKLAFRAAQRKLQNRLDKQCVYFRQEGEVLYKENSMITAKRMILWRAAILSLKGYKQLYRDVEEGDVVSLWNSVQQSGQPNPRDLIVTHLVELIEHTKDGQIGFAAWLLEQQSIVEKLENLEVPLPELLQLGLMLMHLRSDRRYDRTRERICESQWTLTESIQKLETKANDIGDTGKRKQRPDRESHLTDRDPRNGRGGRGGKSRNRNGRTNNPPKQKPICHNFARYGKCDRGDSCRFQHVLQNVPDKNKAPSAQDGDKSQPQQAGHAPAPAPATPERSSKGGGKKKPCFQFIEHGTCARGASCPFSHDDGNESNMVLRTIDENQTVLRTTILPEAEVANPELSHAPPTSQSVTSRKWDKYVTGDLVSTRSDLGHLSSIKAQVVEVFALEVRGKTKRLCKLSPLEDLGTEIEEQLMYGLYFSQIKP